MKHENHAEIQVFPSKDQHPKAFDADLDTFEVAGQDSSGDAVLEFRLDKVYCINKVLVQPDSATELHLHKKSLSAVPLQIRQSTLLQSH